MFFINFLYLLTIYPIEYIFETIFSIISNVSNNIGLSIIFLSLAVNLLILPLYKRADELQAEERDIQAKMANRIKRIKETFKGDERFFMLQEYYRINKYKPIYALKSSTSLLLQIPFFIAAYRLLSGMQSLRGMPFSFISDLGKEDATFMIGIFPVNILPILMTLINVITAVIYTRGHPLKLKIQVFGLAMLFLVLLYHSPSGLVLYWICNNIFSLANNLVTVFKGAIQKKSPIKKVKVKLQNGKAVACPTYMSLFILSCLACTIYVGFYIPVMTIASASEEFINLYSMAHPLFDVIDSTAKSLGLFIFWPTVYYLLSSARGKQIMAFGMFSLACSAILNSKLFGNNYGDMSEFLAYLRAPQFTVKKILLSLALTACCVVICCLISRFGKTIASGISLTLTLVFLLMGFACIDNINSGYSQAVNSETTKAEFTLSKNGRNVVIIMCDRAIGPILPYVFNEIPSLNSTYDGFVYFSNTVSFGSHTNSAIPAMLGGYEYTPDKINSRTDKSLSEKHEEALLLLPRLFTEAGYDATIINPPYAGYQWYPDLHVFDSLKNVKAYSIKNAYVPEEIKEKYKVETTVSFRHNLFCYSVFISSPVVFQKYLYDGGMYNETRRTSPSNLVVQLQNGTSSSEGNVQSFLWNYYAMKSLSDMTKINTGDSNNYVFFATDLTHDTQLLSEPSYIPADIVDNSEYDKAHMDRFVLDGKTMKMNDILDYTHYQCNAAAYLSIGNWLEHLKTNNCYDNTRIIIISDHGYNLGNFQELLPDIKGISFDGEAFAPVLLVKDFGSHGKLKTSEVFMTNADMPFLATKGIIKEPVNPYSGKPISDSGKKDGVTIFNSGRWDIRKENGIKFSPGHWFFIKDNIWNKQNWKYSGTH